MTRPRRQRTRTEPDVIASLRSGAEIDYSPQNWWLLVGAKYFGDYGLNEIETNRASDLLEQWSDEHRAHDVVRRLR